MRQFFLLWLALLFSGLAVSQDSWVPPGNYAQPFAPRASTPSADSSSVMTPSLSIDSPMLAVGATNATSGNIAGAGTSTFSVVSAGPRVIFHQPLWYAPGVKFGPMVYAAASAEQAQAGPAVERHKLELGAATSQSTYGLAQLAAASGARGKARRVYTNSDIARLSYSNGSIRYTSKIVLTN